MPSRRAILILLAIFGLFLLTEQGAYRSYFQDDDLDTLGWTRAVPWSHYVTSLLSWKYFPTNFRPTGHVYYRIMSAWTGLTFPAYVAVLQAINLLNFALLWALLRRFGFGMAAAGTGVVFVAFHKAVLDIYWRPMFVFDALCATFCLLSLLCYMQRRWVLSFAAFWIAYRAKELAVMLPALLAAYEYWFGQRKWKQLVPFFLASASFGIQAMLYGPKSSGTYTMQFVPVVIWQSARFYAQKLLFAYAGFLMLALAWFVRDRRLYLGLLTFWLLLLPMLPLPLRQNRVYLYLPMLGVALVIATLTERQPKVMVPLLGVWLAVFGFDLWAYQKRELAIAQENRTFVSAIRDFVRAHPDTLTYVYDGAPSHMRWWGINGALSYYFREKEWRAENMHVGAIQDRRSAPLLQESPRAMMRWNPGAKNLSIESVP